jgi:AcrR family transcriptional regulator
MSSIDAPRPAGLRATKREATRTALLEAAVSTLIERGVAGTTTLEVQQRAGVSRGNLLHHFRTHAQLLAATVAELVRRNEESVWREHARADRSLDPLAAAIRTLIAAGTSPSNVAELELWAVARTDPALRDVLRAAERSALRERKRVMDKLFAAVADKPGCGLVISLSLEFARGLALSDVLRADRSRRDQLVEGWIAAARTIIDRAPDPAGGAHDQSTTDGLLA